MSKMNRFDVFCTEEVLKMFPNISWELANMIARAQAARKTRFYRKWINEFVKEEYGEES